MNRISDALVLMMHADYSTGMSLAATARKYQRHTQTVRELFQRRGLPIRPDPHGSAKKLPNGKVAPLVPLAWQEIDELIATATKLTVPVKLKMEWRKWSLGKRAVFIMRLRAKLRRPQDAPSGPYSANVVPFDYGTPGAWEIVQRMNKERDSRTAAVKIDISSQGVIWDGRLWFWSHKVGYQCGPWVPGAGRPALHHVLWEKAHRRPVPPHHFLSFADGNRNNLVPGNLVLRHRGDLATENKDKGRTARRRTASFFRTTAAAAQIARALTNV